MSIPRMSFRTGSIQTCISSHPVFERMGFVLRYRSLLGLHRSSIGLEQIAWLSRNQIKISIFLHVTATLHKELIIWDTFQAISFDTYTGPEILFLRGFKVSISLNVTSLIRHVGEIFGGPRSL